MPDDRSPPTALTWAVAPAVLESRGRATALPSMLERYEDRGLVGVGGMGEVRRVFDRRLDCIVAMKLLAPSLVDDAVARRRFVNEGTITAQLRHPGIVAVHDRGELDDGRLWFTMTEVTGDTLGAHRPAREGPPDVQLRRWVAVLARVCAAMAYAHEQGVLHRDLKPDNLMVGRFGEVLVMDWGIAVRTADPPEPPGSVVGTPRYMAPEQARGETTVLGPQSDVYALGVVLHERLVGAPPVHGDTAAILDQHRAHASQPFANGRPPDVPEALVDIATRALADQPSERLADAGALGDALQSWWSGAEQRARAQATLTEAMTAVPRIEERWRHAATHRKNARALLDGLSIFARAEEKEEAWALEDRAADAAREAAVLEADWLQRMGAVLEEAPDLPEAHEALADHYAARLVQAEVDRRPEEVARFEVHLARHDRGAHAALLTGEGAITLSTEPPGARVRAFRFVEQKRRLVPVFQHEVGSTPLVEMPLARGSWLLEINLPGHADVRYPVVLERGGSWVGVRPGGTEPHPVVLPATDELGRHDIYVPAGWFWSGGDPLAIEPLPRRRLWCDGLVVRRHAVTVGDFLALRDTDPILLDARPTGEGWQDRTWTGTEAEKRRPVTGLTLAESIALARAESARTGLSWRLPNELEFEKYARGVDGRYYAWGDHFEVSWANVAGNDPSRGPVPTPVDAHPLDVSVHGVVGCVGNVRERCGNPWLPDGPKLGEGGLVGGGDAPGALVAARGGSATSDARGTRAASRFADPPDARLTRLGMRLVRSFP